jgi:aryl-alcohol dehydrogenase-like predicted oxidoreductase
MERRSIGGGLLEISTIGLGSWAIGGHMWGGQDEAASVDAIHAAVDHGVNWVDTAPIYGSGHSEEVVGRAVKALPSSRRPLIFTKFGLGVDSNAPVRSASAAAVTAECDASLRRLGVEQIDLYQLHWPAPEAIAETAAACHALLEAGKIRAIGVSNFSVAQLEEWQATGVPLHTVQPPFSILRPAVKHDLLPWCAAHGVAAISYSPLFRGLLFGTWKNDKTFPPDDGRSTHKDYAGARFQRHLQAIEAIREVASNGGLSVPQLAVGVLLLTPGLAGVIVGARNRRQGAVISSLGVGVTGEQAAAVWSIAEALAKDLEAM